MAGEYRTIKIPRISEIAKRYENREPAFLRHVWRQMSRRFDQIVYPTNEATYVYLWYHLMVLTDLLKLKSAWDYKKERPMKGVL